MGRKFVDLLLDSSTIWCIVLFLIMVIQAVSSVHASLMVSLTLFSPNIFSPHDVVFLQNCSAIYAQMFFCCSHFRVYRMRFKVCGMLLLSSLLSMHTRLANFHLYFAYLGHIVYICDLQLQLIFVQNYICSRLSISMIQNKLGLGASSPNFM